MKVALFGGSFNPIHNGHLEIANGLIGKKIVDEVWIIPCGNHAFNKELARASDRMNMIHLAIKRNPLIKAVGIELDSNKKSYTSETISLFKRKFSYNFYFVIGADNLIDLDKWHNFEYLKNNTDFILIKRSGFEIFSDLEVNIQCILNINNKVSSSQIRNNIKKRISINGLVPKNVESYIKQRRLYYD